MVGGVGPNGRIHKVPYWGNDNSHCYNRKVGMVKKMHDEIDDATKTPSHIGVELCTTIVKKIPQKV